MAGSSAPKPATDRTPATTRAAAPGRLRRMAGGAAEMVVVLALTLACFGGFLTLLGVAFPAAESLRGLLLQGRTTARTAASARGGAIAGTSTGGAFEEEIASLTVLRPDVRRRAQETIAWDPVRVNTPLHDRDAIQTGDDGRAHVRFDASNDLQIERNSFIVVTRLQPARKAVMEAPESGGDDQAPASLGQRLRGLAITEGDVLVRLRAPDETRLELSVSNVVARLADTTSDAPATFRVSVRKDRSATVAVLEGTLALESAERVVTVGSRQFSRVTADGDISAPRPMPVAPGDCAPASGALYEHLDLPPRVTFSWDRVPGATQYHLRAARDPEFKDMALDETVAADTLMWGRARPGQYWWDVAGVVDELEGLATRVRRLSVTRDAQPPPLVVQTPTALVHGQRLTLRGRTDPDARVFAMGRRAAVGADGEFHLDAELQPGANVVVVESVGAAGQTAYWSQVVHVKL